MAEQPAPPRRYNFDRVVRMGITAGIAVAVVWLLRFLSDVLIPFAVALLLAYLLNPVVQALESRLGRRAPAVLLTVFGGFVVSSSLLVIAVPLAVGQVQDLAVQVQGLKVFRHAQPALTTEPTSRPSGRRLVEVYRDFHGQQPAWLQRAMDSAVLAAADAMTEDNLAKSLKVLATRVAPGLWGVLSGVVSFLVGLTGVVVVFIYLIFILMDFDRVANRWPDLLPPAYRPSILQFVEDFSLAMRRYFRGQVMVAMGTGIVLAAGFWLIGLRMGVLLGLFMGLLNVVPYLQAVGLVPALFIALISALEKGSSVWVALALVLLVFVLAQLVQDVVLGPRILGKATGLRPWTILLGVFIWGKLLGFLGLVLAIPLTCLGLAYYSRFVLGKLNAKVIQEQ